MGEGPTVGGSVVGADGSAPLRRLHSGASGAVVELRPGLVDLKYEYRGPAKRGGARGGARSKVKEFTAAQRRSLRRAAVSFPWDELGRLALVTFTYPDEYPRDMSVVKERHFHVLRMRWRREFGESPRGMWKLEAQRRGAPHLHFFCGLPRGVDVDVFRGWGFRVWTEVTGSDVDWAGVRGSGGFARGDRFNVSEAWYAAEFSAAKVAEYFCRHALKVESAEQNQVPADWVNVGRLWGVVGGRRVSVVRYRLCCPDAAMRVRRVLRSLVARRIGRAVPVRYRRVDGVWAQVPGALAEGPRLVEWAMAGCMCGGLGER